MRLAVAPPLRHDDRLAEVHDLHEMVRDQLFDCLMSLHMLFENSADLASEGEAF